MSTHSTTIKGKLITHYALAAALGALIIFGLSEGAQSLLHPYIGESATIPPPEGGGGNGNSVGNVVGNGVTIKTGKGGDAGCGLSRGGDGCGVGNISGNGVGVVTGGGGNGGTSDGRGVVLPLAQSNQKMAPQNYGNTVAAALEVIPAITTVLARLPVFSV
jgi:hypothetical protein